MALQHLPKGITVRADRGTYVVRVTHEGKRVVVGTYRTLGQAEYALKQARKEIELGIFTPPAQARKEEQEKKEEEERCRMSVADWAHTWIHSCKKAGRTHSTIAEYESKLRVYILPALGSKKLADVTKRDIDAFVAHFNLASAKDRNTVIVLRAMFNAAVEREVIQRSPVKVRIPSFKKGGYSGTDIASVSEVRRLAELMPDKLKLAVYLAAWCALRQGEILGLQRRDFDLENMTVTIERQWQAKGGANSEGRPGYAPPKSRAGYRTISIPRQLIEPIRNHLAAYVGDKADSPVFPGGDLTRPCAQSSFDRYWRKARDQVRPGFRFHNLRHTGLTLYAQQGATLEELRVRAGHSDIDAVLRYQHATRERDRALTAKLDELIH